MPKFPEYKSLVNNHSMWMILLLISSVVLMFIPNGFMMGFVQLAVILLIIIIITDNAYLNGYESGSYETMDYFHYKYGYSHLNEMKQAELLAISKANVTLPSNGRSM